MKPQDAIWNYTGDLGPGISAAATPLTLSTFPFERSLAPRTTQSSGQPYEDASAVWSERPRLPHSFVHGENLLHSATALLSSSRIPFTPTETGSLVPTDNLNRTGGISRGSSILSLSHSGLALINSDSLRVVRPPTARPSRSLANVQDKSLTATWSSSSFLASRSSASPAISMTGSRYGIGGSKNRSAIWKMTAVSSTIQESPKLVDFLESNKNQTESRIRASPWLGRKSLDIHPTRLPLAGLGEEVAIPGLVPVPLLAKATGSHGISLPDSNITSLKTGTSSASANYLASTNKNRTEDRYSERPKPYKPSQGISLPDFSNSFFNQSSNYLGVFPGSQNVTSCSGLVTSTAHVVYETVTSTIMLNETITLGPNATTPLPVLVTPPPACQIINVTCEGAHCPATSPQLNPKKSPIHYTPSTSTSTLLVTKKSAAVVQQLSSVGNLFGPSTPAPPAVAAQPSSDGQQSTGQNSGQSKSEMSTQSHDSSSQQPDGGQSPDKSMPQQNPTNGNPPLASSDSEKSDSQKPPLGSNDGQSTKSDGGAASNSDEHHEAASNNGDTSSNVGASNNEHTVSSGNMKEGGASGDPDVSNNADSSNAKPASSNGRASSNGVNAEGGSRVDSDGTQYVPSITMAGNLPISIVSNTVIIGSHVFKAGSPPTRVVANGQTIAIQPSQIVAQGKTFPIQAAITPPPASSAMIGSVPVVLRPPMIAIGSKTFEHGPSPTSVIYNGQTYSWDAKHLVGPGATMAFPSVDSVPHVTVGGQVFSVFPSQLKASGTNIPLPTIAKVSPFVYKGRTFSINPSQIIAPDTSITLPPARKATPFIYIDHSLSVDASNFMARSTTIPLSSGSGTVTYNGQVLTIKPSEIIGPSTTVALSALDDSAASPTAVTTGGLTFSIGPSAAVVGSSTYSFIPGKAPATVETNGEAVLVGSNGVQFKNVHVPIPTITPSLAAITLNGLAFSIGPSKVVVDGHTDIIHSDMIPITTVIDGHTMSIGPKGVGLASTTIPLPAPKPSFSMAIEGNITFSVAPSEIVVKDKTYSIASNKAPITTDIYGQMMVFGPKSIHIPGTTVSLPVIQTPTSVGASDLSFSVGATDAGINSTAYAIGNGALLQTVVVGSSSMKAESAGVMLPPSAVQTGFSSTLGISGLSSTANATKLLMPVATGRDGYLKHAAGVSMRIPKSSILLGLLLEIGTMMLGLRLL